MFFTAVNFTEIKFIIVNANTHTTTESQNVYICIINNAKYAIKWLKITPWCLKHITKVFGTSHSCD